MIDKKYVEIQISFEIPEGFEDKELTSNEILKLFYDYHFNNEKNQTITNYEPIENFRNMIEDTPIIKFLMWDCHQLGVWYNFKKEVLDNNKKANIVITKMDEETFNKNINEKDYYDALNVVKQIYNQFKNKGVV